ncbi:hypothetical protein MMC19_005351 [Ptychographa xylographoides]|nr:hypothetical protein [Ptychographa xylographoides]
MDAPRAVLLVFLLLFLLISPDTQRSTPHQQLQVKQILEAERQAIDSLNSSHYGDLNVTENRWLNLTGLRQADGYLWNILPKVQARARDQVKAVLKPWTDVEAGSSGWTSLGSRYKSAETIDSGININSNVSTQLRNPFVPFFQNITGIVHGKWVRSTVVEGNQRSSINLTALNPRMQYLTPEYNRNISGLEGDLQIKFDQKKSQKIAMGQSSVREIKAELTIQDETSSGNGWEMTLYGVHYPESGAVLLTTSSDKFAGIFALPHFARSGSTFLLAQKLLNQTLMTTVVGQEEMLRYRAPSFPWSSSPENPSEIMFPTPHCEFIVYLQQHVPDVGGQRSADFYHRLTGLEALEDELRCPTGASLGMIPSMKMSATIFSPDCGFVLESKGTPDYAPQDGKHLHGPKLEPYLLLVKRAILLFSFILVAQIYLLIRQMKETSTPSTRSRISFYTVAIMAMGDGFASIGFWTVSMVIDATFLIMISTAFLAFLSVTFFGMKFLMDIWTIQAPERRERERLHATTSPTLRPVTHHRTTPTVVITPAGAETLPLPATARRPADAPPIILPPDQDLAAAEIEDPTTTPQQAVTQTTTLGSARREMGAIYSRFYFVLMGILFLSMHATGWPKTLRSIYANLLAAAYLSLWVPQIYRNILRNCRKALRWEFVLGQSLLRLTPFMYFYTFTDNILWIENDHYTAYLLAGWVWVQVWALVSQELLGPRFFIPGGWAPPAYDYHPVLREDDEEAGATMPIGFTQATSDDEPSSSTPDRKDKGYRTFDCAICMQDIDVPVVSKSGGESESSTSLATNLFSRRAYMVTPCRHIFHSPCLEGWMRYRLQCPICRENLPPL